MKKNIKLIIGVLIGMIVVSGISVYATLTYRASDISYTKSGETTAITVESALNELYAIKKDYIKPNGTKSITTKANNIDVSNFKFADTTGMYTATEYQNYGTTQYNNGKNAYYKKITNYVWDYNGSNWINVDIGFQPICIYIDSDDGFDVFARNGMTKFISSKKDGSWVGLWGSFSMTSNGFKYIASQTSKGVNGVIYAMP